MRKPYPDIRKASGKPEAFSVAVIHGGQVIRQRDEHRYSKQGDKGSVL